MGVSFVGWGYEISCVMCREGVCGTVYVFLSIRQPEDGHKRRNM